MAGWTKLFSSIVTSSVWCEDDATVRVWIAMLATTDSEGVVEGSIPGFANLARVTVEQMEAAIVKLSSPDPYSRTPDYEGRRIEVIEGGWRILNHNAYKQKAKTGEGSRAPYMREYRRKKRNKNVTKKRTRNTDLDLDLDLDLDKEKEISMSASTKPPKRIASKRFWWDEEKNRVWGTEEARAELKAKWLERGLTAEEFRVQIGVVDRWLEDRPEKRQANSNFANRINNFLNNYLSRQEEKAIS